MYTYRISIKSNFVDIEGTITRKGPMASRDLISVAEAFVSRDDMKDAAIESRVRGYRICLPGKFVAECELID